ncbi:MAG: hypothetical protein B7Z75_12970 [Acidocella sp. 20-57-95]|nr:MAG: hypothetical protein B7Z75_12970 [Acidocella sp. 20-57-95]OYV57896.1 MAG: hypothetical protein B7Z71_11720 [Acidocella sp. 21-58-7]HQT65055.1 prepilin peptidase [Acidocella sp.]HQU05434.1 prepilin peptidase [Acidocella sp.]
MVKDGLILGAMCLLCYAALHDVIARTVPNWLSGCVLLLGVAVRIADHSLRGAAVIAGITFIVLFAIWFFGVMGGGDVKLWAATVLLIPPQWQAELMFFLHVLLIGGALGVVYLALWRPVSKLRAVRSGWRRVGPVARSQNFVSRVWRAEMWRIARKGPLPYAVAISAGAISSLVPFSIQA